jgi:YbgC/YbaW family acyl-CoA thioester hydrolase
LPAHAVPGGSSRWAVEAAFDGLALLDRIRAQLDRWIRGGTREDAGPVPIADHTEIREIARRMAATKAELDRAVVALRSWSHRARPQLEARQVSGSKVATECSIRVRWSESDPAGIVFYPRFFEWFDLATDSLFVSLGLPWADLFPEHGIVGVPILECGARFDSPVGYGDEVRIRSAVTEVGTKTFRVDHEVWVADRRCVTGFEVRAWVPRPRGPGERLAAAVIPDEVARRLRGGAGART